VRRCVRTEACPGWLSVLLFSATERMSGGNTAAARSCQYGSSRELGVAEDRAVLAQTVAGGGRQSTRGRAAGRCGAVRSSGDVHARTDLRGGGDDVREALRERAANQPLEPARDCRRSHATRACPKHLATLDWAFFKKEADLKPHRVRYWLTPKPDPAFDDKCADICGVYKVAAGADDSHRTISIDEMTGIQALERIAPGLPMVPGHGHFRPSYSQLIDGGLKRGDLPHTYPCVGRISLRLVIGDQRTKMPRQHRPHPLGDWIMSHPRKTFAACAIAALAIAAAPTEASAGDGGRVAAGLLGGFAAAAIIGSAIAPLPYYAPAPVYVVPAPAYVGPACYWTRGEPVWIGYRWVASRVRVCD
jgi:hypothetical protein